MTAKVCHCEEQSDVAIYDYELLRCARNDGMEFAMTANVCHCEERSDVAIYDCGLLRCTRNDWIAACNDIIYRGFK